MGIGGVDSSRLNNALGIEERLEEVREENRGLQRQRHGSKHKEGEGFWKEEED